MAQVLHQLNPRAEKKFFVTGWQAGPFVSPPARSIRQSCPAPERTNKKLLIDPQTVKHEADNILKQYADKISLMLSRAGPARRAK